MVVGHHTIPCKRSESAVPDESMGRAGLMFQSMATTEGNSPF